MVPRKRSRFYWLKVYCLLAIFWNLARWWWSNYENVFALSGVLIFTLILALAKGWESWSETQIKKEKRNV